MLTTKTDDDDDGGDHDDPRDESPEGACDEVVCLRPSAEVLGNGNNSQDTCTYTGIIQLSGEVMQLWNRCGMSSVANPFWFGAFASAVLRTYFNILIPSVWTTDSFDRQDSESRGVSLDAKKYPGYYFYKRYALPRDMCRGSKTELYARKSTSNYTMNTSLPHERLDLQSAGLNRNLCSSTTCSYERPSLRVIHNNYEHSFELRIQKRPNYYSNNKHGKPLEEIGGNASRNFNYQQTEQLCSRRDHLDPAVISGGRGSQIPESRLCTMIMELRSEMLHLKEYDVQLLLQLRNIRASIAEIKQSIKERGSLCYSCGNDVTSVSNRSISSDGSSDETIVFNETTAQSGKNDDASRNIIQCDSDIEDAHCRVINWLEESYFYFNIETDSTENDLKCISINKFQSDRSRTFSAKSLHHLPENTRRPKLRIELDNLLDESCLFSECVRTNTAVMRILERSTTVSYPRDVDRARTLGFYHAIYADDAGPRSFPFLSNQNQLNQLNTPVKFRPRPRLHRQVNYSHSFDATFDGKSAKIILSESELPLSSVKDVHVQDDINVVEEEYRKKYIPDIKTELRVSADNITVIALANAEEECDKDELLEEDGRAITFRTENGSGYQPLSYEIENWIEESYNDNIPVNENELQRKYNSGDFQNKGDNHDIVLVMCDHANVDTATSEKAKDDLNESYNQEHCEANNKVANTTSGVETYEDNTEETDLNDNDSDSSSTMDVFDKCEGIYVNLQDGFATCRIMSPGLQAEIEEQRHPVEDNELEFLQIVDGRVVVKPRDMFLEIDHDDAYFIDALFFDDKRCTL